MGIFKGSIDSGVVFMMVFFGDPYFFGWGSNHTHLWSNFLNQKACNSSLLGMINLP